MGVNLKTSINSSKDRGHYKAFDHDSMNWGFGVEYDESERKFCMAQTCALTQEDLKEPVAACRFGFLFNKAALSEALVTKTLDSKFKHIRNSKDIFDVHLTRDPEFTE